MSENDFTPIPDGFKKCKRCREVKLLGEFYHSKLYLDGYESKCKICRIISRGRTPRPPRDTSVRLFPEMGVAQIPLTKGYFATVDIIDADLAEFKWVAVSSNSRSYAQRRGRTTRDEPQFMSLHRAILERAIGRPLLSNEFTDHINGNSLDNRRCNLRVATPGENARNRFRNRKTASGYKGVHLRPSGRWSSGIQANGKRIWLGTFDTPEDAFAAYCKAAELYHKEFARFE